jgi:glycosyltransferase involved in cell wall biosynthesis
LIVVDNSANAGERDAVALQQRSQQGGRLPVIYVHEPVPGIPNARNAGLNAVSVLSPDWIAFIDDDEIAPPDWIARLHATALHYDADVVSGKVIQFSTSDEAQSGAENWTVPPSFGKARRRLTCPTSNVIFRASILSGEPVLRFDESMQHGGSDVEFFMRAGQRGARIFHVKDATVFEEYPAERKTVGYECKRAFRVGTTTNYRYMKNYGNLPGAALLVGRVITKTATAVGSAAVGFVAYPFARSLAERNLGRGVRSAATALGFVGPLFGFKPGRYW